MVPKSKSLAAPPEEMSNVSTEGSSAAYDEEPFVRTHETSRSELRPPTEACPRDIFELICDHVVSLSDLKDASDRKALESLAFFSKEWTSIPVKQWWRTCGADFMAFLRLLPIRMDGLTIRLAGEGEAVDHERIRSRAEYMRELNLKGVMTVYTVEEAVFALLFAEDLHTAPSSVSSSDGTSHLFPNLRRLVFYATPELKAKYLAAFAPPTLEDLTLGCSESISRDLSELEMLFTTTVKLGQLWRLKLSLGKEYPSGVLAQVLMCFSKTLEHLEVDYMLDEDFAACMQHSRLKTLIIEDQTTPLDIHEGMRLGDLSVLRVNSIEHAEAPITLCNILDSLPSPCPVIKEVRLATELGFGGADAALHDISRSCSRVIRDNGTPSQTLQKLDLLARQLNGHENVFLRYEHVQFLEGCSSLRLLKIDTSFKHSISDGNLGDLVQSCTQLEELHLMGEEGSTLTLGCLPLLATRAKFLTHLTLGLSTEEIPAIDSRFETKHGPFAFVVHIPGSTQTTTIPSQDIAEFLHGIAPSGGMKMSLSRKPGDYNGFWEDVLDDFEEMLPGRRGE
ncbi:hypothetical protein GGF50DRAFT_117443 [Schizophyllum commune]